MKSGYASSSVIPACFLADHADPGGDGARKDMRDTKSVSRMWIGVEVWTRNASSYELTNSNDTTGAGIMSQVPPSVAFHWRHRKIVFHISASVSMSSDSQDEQCERYRELLEELRTIIPGAQVLFAFLLTLPLASRFLAHLTAPLDGDLLSCATRGATWCARCF